MTAIWTCPTCVHYGRRSEAVGLFCAAFPAGIPDDILAGIVTHERPYEGDNGIQYEPAEMAAPPEETRR